LSYTNKLLYNWITQNIVHKNLISSHKKPSRTYQKREVNHFLFHLRGTELSFQVQKCRLRTLVALTAQSV